MRGSTYRQTRLVGHTAQHGDPFEKEITAVSLDQMAGTKAKGMEQPLFREYTGVHAINALPDVPTTSIKYLKFADGTMSALADLPQAKFRDGTIETEGVTFDGSALCALPGVQGDYRDHPNPTAREDQKSAGIKQTPDDRAQLCMEIVIDLFFSLADFDRTILVRDKSAEGFPWGFLPIGEKLTKRYATMGNLVKHRTKLEPLAERMLASQDMGFLRYLRDHFNVPVAKAGARTQMETPEKDRSVHLADGRVVTIDKYYNTKRLGIHSVLGRKFGAVRDRAVYGCSHLSKTTLSALSAPLLHGVKTLPAYKNRGLVTMNEAGKGCIGGLSTDNKQMDRMVPHFFTEAMIAKVSNTFGPIFGAMFWADLHAPVICSPIQAGGSPFVVGELLFDKWIQNYYGLTSGTPLNSFFGRTWMTFIFLLDLVALKLVPDPMHVGRKVVEERLLTILNHQDPRFKWFCEGDDCAWFFYLDGMLRKRVKTYLESGQNQYVSREVDPRFAFCGALSWWCREGIRFTLSDRSYLEKQVFTERSRNKPEVRVDEATGTVIFDSGMFARAWPIAMEQRDAVYAGSPMQEQLAEVQKRAAHRAGFRYFDWYMNQYSWLKTALEQAKQVFTELDWMVLMKPDMIHYAVDPEELSAAGRAALGLDNNIPASDNRIFLRQMGVQI